MNIRYWLYWLSSHDIYYIMVNMLLNSFYELNKTLPLINLSFCAHRKPKAILIGTAGTFTQLGEIIQYLWAVTAGWSSSLANIQSAVRKFMRNNPSIGIWVGCNRLISLIRQWKMSLKDSACHAATRSNMAASYIRKNFSVGICMKRGTQ